MGAVNDNRTKIGTSFHQTYPLNRLGIAEIMRAIGGLPISRKTGTRLSASAVHEHTRLSKRHFNALISYAIGCNLVKGDLGFTHFGLLTQQHDPEFNLPATQWLMHYHLCRLVGKNPLFWRSLVVHWLQGSVSLDVASGLQVIQQSSYGTVTSTGLRRALTVFVSSYDNFEGLYQLRLVERQKGYVFAAKQWDIPDNVVLYTIADHWDNNWQERQSVNLSAIMCNDGPLGFIQMQPDSIVLALRRLEAAGMLDFQRNIPPFEIYKRWITVEAALESVFTQQSPSRRRKIRSHSVRTERTSSEQTE